MKNTTSRFSEGNGISLIAERKRLRKGEAKIQFIACGERIAELRAEGLDIKATYNQLVRENLITMTYTGFYENVTQRQLKKTHRNRPEDSGSAALKTLPKTPSGLKVKKMISPQTTEWSLDKKLEALNMDSPHSKRSEKNATTEESFQEFEVL